MTKEKQECYQVVTFWLLLLFVGYPLIFSMANLITQLPKEEQTVADFFLLVFGLPAVHFTSLLFSLSTHGIYKTLEQWLVRQ